VVLAFIFGVRKKTFMKPAEPSSSRFGRLRHRRGAGPGPLLVGLALAWLSVVVRGEEGAPPALASDTQPAAVKEAAPAGEAVGSPEAAWLRRMQLLDQPPMQLPGGDRLPDAVFLRDQANQPIFIPRVRYEEFEAYLRERALGKANDLPQALLESLRIRGVVFRDYAQLQLELSMSVTDSTARLVRLPLRLQGMNWTSVPRGQGGKKNLVVASADDGGLEWLVEPDGSNSYALQLESVVKVEQLFTESWVRLELPEVATSISLDLPGDNLQVQWEGAVGEVLETEAVGGKTAVTVRGRGGVASLRWSDRALQDRLGAVEVESDTRLVLQEDGKSFRGLSRIRVVADGRHGARDWTLRLPAKARWVPMAGGETNSGWRLERIEAGGDRVGDASERLRLFLAERARPTGEEIAVEWRWDSGQVADEPLSFRGLEIEEAQRHEGRFTIVLPLRSRFSWPPGSDQVLVQQVPSADSAEAMDYEFRFFRQPFQLNGLISEEKTAARWSSDYIVRLDGSELVLEGILTPPSDRKSFVGWELLGGVWQVESVVSEKTGEPIRTEMIDGHGLRILGSDNGLLEEVGRNDGLAGGGPAAIRIRASQALPTGEVRQVSFQLPRFRIMTAGSPRIQRGEGTLVVDYGAWQIFPTELKTSGLVKTAEIPNSLRGLLVNDGTPPSGAFRFLADGPEPRWSGRIRRTSRVVSASLTTGIEVGRTDWRCLRRWTITTQGPVLERLPLRVPSRWIETDATTGTEVVSESLKIASDGQRLETRFLTKDADGWATIEPVRLNWPSVFDLEVSYEEGYRLVGEGDSGEQTLPIPLVKLGLKPAVLLYAEESTLNVGDGVLCRVDMAGLPPRFYGPADGAARVPLDEAQLELKLGVAAVVSATARQADVERLWIQTVINKQERRDRYVARLSTTQPLLHYELPAGWSVSNVSALVNGRKVLFDAMEKEGRRVIQLMMPFASGQGRKLEGRSSNADGPLAESGPAGEDLKAVVELFHWSTEKRGWTDRLELALPKLQESLQPTPLLWQVCVPADEHLWSSSPGLLANHRWAWNNLGWQRLAAVSQGSLETELGASRQLELSAATNSYTFTALTGEATAGQGWGEHILVLPRYLLWLPVACLALLFTAAWPRLGITRHPWMLLAVTIVLGMLSLWAPDMAMILIQAALASLGVVALVAAVRWAVHQRGHRRSVFAGRASPSVAGRPTSAGFREDSKRKIVTEGSAAPSHSATHTVEHVPVNLPSDIHG
jgi:hypothetical protein